MKKIKGLLYCTKKKPSLMKYENIDGYYTDTDPVLDKRALLNGKIVAECEIEVEEITPSTWNVETERRILKGSCLKEHQLFDYIIKGDENESQNPFYAIHIKNLHIFDEPKELYDFTTRTPVEYDSIICDSCTNFNFDCKKCRYSYDYQQVIKAPKNMMKVCEWDIEDKVLISIRPEYLVDILNGNKTIEIRKKILKGMI